MNIEEFLHMGGYAFYVWTSYGIAFLVLALNIIVPIFQQRQTLIDIERKKQRSQMMQQ